MWKRKCGWVDLFRTPPPPAVIHLRRNIFRLYQWLVVRMRIFRSFPRICRYNFFKTDGFSRFHKNDIRESKSNFILINVVKGFAKVHTRSSVPWLRPEISWLFANVFRRGSLGSEENRNQSLWLLVIIVASEKRSYFWIQLNREESANGTYCTRVFPVLQE